MAMLRNPLAKAHISHMESRRLEPREYSLQPKRLNVYESALRQKPVGRVRRWTGSSAE
jgi:hypothetical protein